MDQRLSWFAIVFVRRVRTGGLQCGHEITRCGQRSQARLSGTTRNSHGASDHSACRRTSDDFDYGNRDISGGIDQFWLTGSLRISSLEQVEFLRRFYHGELGISARTTRIARELLILEERARLPAERQDGLGGAGRGRCPTGGMAGGLPRAWRSEVYFYATNIRIRDAGDAAARHAITRRILVDLGLLAPDSIESATR
jgi:beta-lactamase class D